MNEFRKVSNSQKELRDGAEMVRWYWDSVDNTTEDDSLESSP